MDDCIAQTFGRRRREEIVLSIGKRAALRPPFVFANSEIYFADARRAARKQPAV
jgi:hypothetical protein